MGNVLIQESNLQAIADAIRCKTGGTDTYKPREMAPAIRNLPGTGVLQNLSVTENGNYTPGAGVDGFNSVSVAVPNSALSSTDEGKVVVNGALMPQTSLNVTQNGTYDTTDKNSIVVNVSAGTSQRFPNGCPMQVYYEWHQGNMNVTQMEQSISFFWGSGQYIGANCWLNYPIPAQLTKIKYHIEVGSSAYDNLRTLRFRPALGVKASSTSAAGAGPNTSDWLALNVYDTLNYSGDEELDLSGVTGPFYLILCGHGCNATFSNFEFVFE